MISMIISEYCQNHNIVSTIIRFVHEIKCGERTCKKQNKLFFLQPNMYDPNVNRIVDCEIYFSYIYEKTFERKSIKKRK